MIMTPEEKTILQNAVLSIADPIGNWGYGWKKICELAGMDAAQFPAPFRKRDLEQEAFQKLRKTDTDSASSGHRSEGDKGSTDPV